MEFDTIFLDLFLSFLFENPPNLAPLAYGPPIAMGLSVIISDLCELIIPEAPACLYY